MPISDINTSRASAHTPFNGGGLIMMRKLLFLSFALVSAGVSAAISTPPSISGVSGNLTQGSAVTVSGTGFSTKRNGQILFDNFNDGATGDPISARGAWTHLSAGGTIPEYVISTANPYIGGKSARVTVGVDSNPGSGSSDDFGDYFRYDSDQTELYMEASTYIHFNVAGPSVNGSQIKMFRGITDGDPTVAPDPNITITRANGSTAASNTVLALASSGYASESFYAPDSTGAYDSIPPDSWNQFCYYEKLSTPGSADGKRFININGKNDITFSSYPGTFSDPSNTGVTNRAWDGAAMMTRSSGTTAAFRRLYLPFYKRMEMSLVVDIGYVYLNDSPERVVVHNAPTLAASTRYQVQKQTSRGASSITIEFQQGKLLASDSKYVTVVNSDNTFSTSFLAGSAGTADIPSSPPTNLKAQKVSQ